MMLSLSKQSNQSSQESKKMKLDFGCGQAKTPGYLGLDGFAGSDIDIVHDFDVFPYPFADSVFDEIICRSSLEHVSHFMETMVELHRIAKPDAVIRMEAPTNQNIQDCLISSSACSGCQKILGGLNQFPKNCSMLILNYMRPGSAGYCLPKQSTTNYLS
jgi:hypothetical protein